MALIQLSTVAEVEAATGRIDEAVRDIAAASVGIVAPQDILSWAGSVVLPEQAGLIVATLTGNVTLELPAREAGRAESVNLFLVQDDVGGRALTIVSAGARTSFGVAPVLSTAPGSEDWLTLLWRGDSWRVVVSGLNQRTF